MVQRSECLVLCARGRLRPCTRDGLFRTARRGAFAGWELGAGAPGRELGGGGWQNGAGLITRGPRVTLADALLATEQCETEKDAVGGGSGLEPGPGPADGVYRLQAAQHRQQQTSDGRTNERGSQRASQLFVRPTGVDGENHGKCRSPASSRAKWKAKNGRWSGTRSPRGAVQSERAAASWLRRERDA